MNSFDIRCHGQKTLLFAVMWLSTF